MAQQQQQIDLEQLVHQILDVALYHVGKEVRRSMTRFGDTTPRDLNRSMNILSQEVGEVAAEILKMTNPTGRANYRNATGTKDALITELSHTANVCVQMIYNLEMESK